MIRLTSMMARYSTFVMAGFFTAIGCKKSQSPCPEFDQAETVFNALNDELLDATFGNPRFEEAAVLFEAIPDNCPRKDTATTIAQTIREGMAARAALPKAVVNTYPPPQRAEARPKTVSAPMMRPPSPKDEAEAKKQCGAFIAEARVECPAACRKANPDAIEGSCIDVCEERIAEILDQVGCPKFPRLPKQAKDPTSSEAPPPPPPPVKKRRPKKNDGKWTYCAFFLPNGNQKQSYCVQAPLKAVQEDCDQTLAKRGISGTCACTDDAAFIGDRCR